MLPKNSVIKKTARESLSGSWAQIMLALLMLAGVCILPVLISEITGEAIKAGGGFILTRDLNAAADCFTAVFCFFLAGPLALGLLKMFWVITAGQTPELSTLFCFFIDRKSYRLALKTQFAVLWRAAVAAAVCMLPYAILRFGHQAGLDQSLGVAADIAKYGLIDKAFSVCTSVFSLAAFVIAVSFVPLPFVMINRPDRPMRDIVADTKRINKMFPRRYLYFVLSFIGWFFLSLFVLPILFALPFFLASWAVLVRFSIFHASKTQTV